MLSTFPTRSHSVGTDLFTSCSERLSYTSKHLSPPDPSLPISHMGKQRVLNHTLEQYFGYFLGMLTTSLVHFLSTHSLLWLTTPWPQHIVWPHPGTLPSPFWLNRLLVLASPGLSRSTVTHNAKGEWVSKCEASQQPAPSGLHTLEEASDIKTERYVYSPGSF